MGNPVSDEPCSRHNPLLQRLSRRLPAVGQHSQAGAAAVPCCSKGTYWPEAKTATNTSTYSQYIHGSGSERETEIFSAKQRSLYFKKIDSNISSQARAKVTIW